MTQDQYFIRRKLNILELGEMQGNISEACCRLNISRQHHHDINSAVAEEGIEGLLEKSLKVPRIGNRVGSRNGVEGTGLQLGAPLPKVKFVFPVS